MPDEPTRQTIIKKKDTSESDPKRTMADAPAMSAELLAAIEADAAETYAAWKATSTEE